MAYCLNPKNGFKFRAVYLNTGMSSKKYLVAGFLFFSLVEKLYSKLSLFVNICKYVASVVCAKSD